MTYTSPRADVSELLTKPMLMAMLSSVFLTSIWGEVLTTRFEFKPVLTSYTVLCNHNAKHEIQFLKALCKDQEKATALAVADR